MTMFMVLSSRLSHFESNQGFGLRAKDVGFVKKEGLSMMI